MSTTDQPNGDQQPDIAVAHNPEQHRYELRDGNSVIGFTAYRLAAEERQMVFVHTEVDPGYEGRGLAQRLAKFALDDVREQGKRVVPVCSFIAGFLAKDHSFDDIVDQPQGSGSA
ncbi:GNAT family N-acetyltransferase [Saxibacter everestensis]|uniref:GNAT family N-acetyltransferase n=1 Tax=Saxibacter everestensis TaxID=2909229 RepID=A0ABY8QUK9_9MICO|nr:GNAT family N-acetyltransferase [Brevibacteriaceae bacterium ZFBP1038]